MSWNSWPSATDIRDSKTRIIKTTINVSGLSCWSWAGMCRVWPFQPFIPVFNFVAYFFLSWQSQTALRTLSNLDAGLLASDQYSATLIRSPQPFAPGRPYKLHLSTFDMSKILIPYCRWSPAHHQPICHLSASASHTRVCWLVANSPWMRTTCLNLHAAHRCKCVEHKNEGTEKKELDWLH